MRGGTQNFQGLHSDLGLGRVPHDQQRSLPAAKIAVNFAVEDVFFDNGPMRVVPRRKVLTNREQPLAFLDEPSAHELGTVALQPLKAGAAVIRDLRLWHSGTPNFGKSTRFLPDVEVCSLEYATHIDDPRHTFTQTECTATAGQNAPSLARNARSLFLQPCSHSLVRDAGLTARGLSFKMAQQSLGALSLTLPSCRKRGKREVGQVKLRVKAR